MKKSNENPSTAIYIANIALRLVAICAVIALLVATVNYFAAPVIAENERRAMEQAIAELAGNETIKYDVIDVTIDPEHVQTVDEVYSVSDADGTLLGYCVKLSPTGFKGEIDLITFFAPDGFITGVKITSTNDETTGIGTKVADDPSFAESFIESSGNTISDSADDYVISGSTKTSKPVAQSVIIAKSIISNLIDMDMGVSLTDGSTLSEQLAEDAVTQNTEVSDTEVSEEGMSDEIATVPTQEYTKEGDAA